MNLYIETAASYERDWADERGLLDGAWVSLGALASVRQPLFETLYEFCAEATQPVLVEVSEGDPFKWASRLAKVAPVVVPHFLVSDEALCATRELTRAGGQVVLTCCSATQALLAARAGASRVFVSESLLEKGVDTLEIAQSAQELLDGTGLMTEVVLAGVESMDRLNLALSLGLSVAAPVRVLRLGLENPLADVLLGLQRETARLIPVEEE